MLESDGGPVNVARPHNDHVSLADALDRILQRGVSLEGNLTIGLADVDLLFLDLRLLLGSVDTIWPDGRPPVPGICPHTPPSLSPPSSPALREPTSARVEIGPRDLAPPSADGRSPVALKDQGSAEGSSTARGLIRLVLTLVKLLHDVLERQAVHRMEAGRLTEAQVENLGAALFAQADEISRLQRQFGFSKKDISLDLGAPEGAL